MLNRDSESLNSIFTDEVILYLKNNKHEITDELLTELRSYGNDGKHLALEILDTEQDGEGFYLDSFGNRIAYKGNRQLKKSFSQLNLSPIHISEIEKCANDIHYYKDNYLKIRTKTGVNFPDVRGYQNEFLDSILPDENEMNLGLMGRQSGKSISTSIYLSWLYNFDREKNIGIVANKGAMAREFLSNTKNMISFLPIWMQQGTIVWNKGSIENESGMRILTDSPSADSFRGWTISCLVVDECAFVRTTIWEEFSDSIFPSQSGIAWKKNIILSTAKGMNHFFDMVDGARRGINGMNLFEVDWKDVPRYKSDGTRYSNEEFKSGIVKKYGDVYFQQNYGNNFLGSSNTLVSANILKDLKQTIPDLIVDGLLKIYVEPIKGHQYIMAVDPAKDGRDAFAVQVVDITDYQFVQVATAKLEIEYLRMPEYISEWCQYYFNPLLIIENNEGAGQSIADQMFLDYDYQNLYYDLARQNDRSRKKYPGFRTTTKTRKQILNTLKLFMEANKLIIHDKDTISEFMTFILSNNKFQAADGAHDDMIMSLAIIFAPFCSARNFEDMAVMIKNLYNDDINLEDRVDFGELLSVGSFDDFTDDIIEESVSGTHRIAELLSDEMNGFM